MVKLANLMEFMNAQSMVKMSSYIIQLANGLTIACSGSIFNGLLIIYLMVYDWFILMDSMDKPCLDNVWNL